MPEFSISLFVPFHISNVQANPILCILRSRAPLTSLQIYTYPSCTHILPFCFGDDLKVNVQCDPCSSRRFSNFLLLRFTLFTLALFLGAAFLLARFLGAAFLVVAIFNYLN